MHYVHPFNVQIVEIVHTDRLYAGKMMGLPCDPSVHDVIGLHRLIGDGLTKYIQTDANESETQNLVE